MDKALSPINNDLIDTNEYKKFATNNGYQLTNLAPPARCPVCKGGMRIRAGKLKDNEHFYHIIRNGDCDTKEPAARPYLALRPQNIDHKAVISNRDFLINNIEVIYYKLNEIVPFLDFKNEFIAILERAKELNIYAYANLNQVHLPYILVTLINFLPNKSKNKKRLLKFIFFYEGDLRSFDDLWINRGINSTLYRMSYDVKSIKGVVKIDIEIDYLNNSEAKKYLSEKQIDWIRKVY